MAKRRWPALDPARSPHHRRCRHRERRCSVPEGREGTKRGTSAASASLSTPYERHSWPQGTLLLTPRLGQVSLSRLALLERIFSFLKRSHSCSTAGFRTKHRTEPFHFAPLLNQTPPYIQRATCSARNPIPFKAQVLSPCSLRWQQGSVKSPSQAMASGGKALQRAPTLPSALPLDFLKKITNDFTSEEIGKGAFGTFYKGTLEDGANISVLKLQENSPVPKDQVFEKEVQNIMVLEHKNIAKMVASCRETPNKLVKYNDRYIVAEITETILCYEYLPQGTLDKHIFGETSSMDWNTRFKIIKGITKGIQFLHNLPQPILHLGLSPSNIWLDDNMVPKISDFGFSRIFGQGQTRKNTQSQVGTVGYMAPEYLYKGEISARSDIYSLGLIIMEIATKEKNSSTKGQKDTRDYIEKVKENWTLDKIMSEHQDLDGDGPTQVETCINIGLRCVEIDQDKRPRINEIVNELN